MAEQLPDPLAKQLLEGGMPGRAGSAEAPPADSYAWSGLRPADWGGLEVMSNHYRAQTEGAPWTWGSLAVAGVIVVGLITWLVHLHLL